MKEPFVSIIVNFYNSASILEECLESIFAVDYGNYEVLAIDDCSTDNSAEIAKRFPVIYHKTPKNSGVAGSRNFGIKKAKGEIIIITDSDCVVSKNWIKEMVGPFDDPKIGIAGCRDKAPKNDTFFAKCVDYALTSLIGTGGLRSSGKIKLSYYFPRGFSFTVRKKVYDDVGLFDTNIVPGEEIDLGLRAKKKGYKFAFVANTVVLHKRRPTLKSYFKQMYRRGYARFLLGQKHKGSLELLYILPAVLSGGIIFLGLSSLFSIIFTGLFSLLSFIIFGLFSLNLASYSLVLFLAGIHSIFKVKDTRAFFVVPFILFLQHFLYSFGFIKAMFRIGRLEDKRDSRGI